MILSPWSRATPPGAKTGAAYLTIMNHGAVPEMLTGGSTSAAAEVQIHQMSNTGGVMWTMRAPDLITASCRRVIPSRNFAKRSSASDW